MVVNSSVIITNYNNEEFLGRCIRSCLKQSLDKNRYEVIVVDDASTDKSQEVIETFGDQIVSVRLNKNVGVAEASNMGIKRALGAFIIRVDSDDYVNENTLLFMTEILWANPDIGFVYADGFVVDSSERKVKRYNLDTLKSLYRHGAGIMFRKSNLEAVGLYDRTFRNAEDYDLLTRYFRNFDGYHLRLPLYRYYRHKGSLTKSKKMRKLWEKRARLKYG